MTYQVYTRYQVPGIYILRPSAHRSDNSSPFWKKHSQMILFPTSIVYQVYEWKLEQITFGRGATGYFLKYWEHLRSIACRTARIVRSGMEFN